MNNYLNTISIGPSPTSIYIIHILYINAIISFRHTLIHGFINHNHIIDNIEWYFRLCVVCVER